MSSGQIHLETTQSVDVLTIDNPKRRNALDGRMIDTFVETLSRLAQSSSRPLVIIGKGDNCFCAGYDIREIDPDQKEEEPLPDVRFELAVLSTLQYPMPVIAAMNGDAYGGGLDLALACDLRIARSGAEFAMTPCKLGLVYSADGIARFIAKLGGALTRRLFLTGLSIGVQEAHRLGIVDELVDQDAVLERALCSARDIAKYPVPALLGTRFVIQQVEKAGSLEPKIKEKIEQLRRAAFTSGELKNNLLAFKNNR